MFEGLSIRVADLGEGLAELCFDRSGEKINKLDVRTVDELAAATKALAQRAGLRGVLVTSAKDEFIVGADIFEFTGLFAKTEAEIAAYNGAQAAVFTALEDLPVPVVVAVNGLSLGGGFETALAADARVLADTAQVGLPEVTLGIFPGFGGSVRLPRLIGAAAALDWISSGRPRKAAAALDAGAADAVVPKTVLRETALQKLKSLASSGDWRALRARRRGAVTNFDAAAFAELKAAAAKTAAHTPAALMAAELIEAAAPLDRDAAAALEAQAFARVAKTPAAAALVQIFINDQALKKLARGYTQAGRKANRAAVLGAGIMGGGIAYASAVKNTPVLMKDIRQEALDLGKREAKKLLDKQLATGRMKPEAVAAVDAAIVPTLNYDEFGRVDIVVEAVVENLAVKKSVLAEVEARLGADAVLASNTSSLSISELGTALQRPAQFAGMHFFNPVPVMPLVEVIRGDKTSDVTAATVAAYAVAMGKTPIVVKDCPGFLVNRILTAYFVGFLKLLRDGADFEAVDRAMEAFGWPMGPAYLQDVIGMDTSSHVIAFISAGYPQRMGMDFEHAIALMAREKRYGQKSGQGFYRYEADAKGRLVKQSSEEAKALVATLQPQGARTFSDAEIVERLMLPMIIESAICLEDGVVGSAAELDMSLLLGLGFPRHWGGALKYADLLGLAHVVTRCAQYAALGPAYQPTATMRALANSAAGFYR